MRCVIWDCPNEAVPPFLGCSKEHGWQFKSYWLPLLEKALSGNHHVWHIVWYQNALKDGGNPEKPPRMELTIEQAIHYSRYIKTMG